MINIKEEFKSLKEIDSLVDAIDMKKMPLDFLESAISNNKSQKIEDTMNRISFVLAANNFRRLEISDTEIIEIKESFIADCVVEIMRRKLGLTIERLPTERGWIRVVDHHEEDVLKKMAELTL